MTMDKMVAELRELKRMQEELAAEIEKIQDEIKAQMTEQQVDELHGTDWKVTWKAVSSARFDSKAFQKADPETYALYIKKQSTRRFLVA